jgi:hypothetical protein
MNLGQLAPEDQQLIIHLSEDLPFFSSSCLKVVDKQGQLVPFKFNQAQWYIHTRVEEQKKRTGRVRMVIIKGRQEGCSTYIEARYFHQTLFNPNQSAYILAHQSESTLKIFSMASRFYNNLPSPLQFPKLKDTEKSMLYEQGSSYTVGTAGSSQVGRGMTVQLFHGSEVAFYENTEELSTGLMQTVADLPGTEVFLESTANGPGNFFHTKVQQALNGKGDFELIFIPWYWMDEYTRHFELTEADLTDQERLLLETYSKDPIKPMTIANLAWRRNKIVEFEDKEWKFNQEYPCNVQEAFIHAEERFFDLRKLYAAAKRRMQPDRDKPLIIGVDQGRTGDDTEIARRVANVIMPLETIPADDGQERDMRLAGRIAKIIETEHPDMVFVDTTNEHGAVDRLHEMGYKKIVKGIHFGQQATDPKRHRNKRTEMHIEFRDWTENDNSCIPDDQKLMSECGAIPKEKETSNNLQYIESKDTIKSKLGWSPNKLDAIILTFAYPVRKKLMPMTSAYAPRPQNNRPRQDIRPQLSTMKGVK